MALEKTWRWFGMKDSVKLADLRQMGIEGVVTSLHHIPNGEIWPTDEIRKVQDEIERHGMRWSVVESLPVSEGIKIHSADYPRLIANYKQSLEHLGACGIDTVCYNFMPVLDWARTDLHYNNALGGESMLFDYPTFAAFDMYILKREGAAADYPEALRQKAEMIVSQLTPEQKEELAHNIIVVTQAFINGVVSEDTKDYKQLFGDYLKRYAETGKEKLRRNLSCFLHDVVPVAEKAGVALCIHPDDPPFPLLGLPRIAGTLEDLQWIVNQYDSPSNAITFCTGSLSARKDNDPAMMVKALASRINFVHLRNTQLLDDGSFCETGHLEGHVNMYTVVKILLEEQIRRAKSGRKDIRMPFRPDHGIRLLDDFTRTANPGYPLIGRLKGLAEMDGLQYGIEQMLKGK